MFMFTINLGGAFIDFFDQAAGAIFVDTTRYLINLAGLPQMFAVVAADGLGGGIQIVATFIPIIGFLYLFLSFLEDSGYMARAAFLMDQLMRKVGLPGKAFVPLIVGFGCNVPAIMASRTLEQQNDRILTTMMSPFMSCGARLTIYALFTAAFFPTNGPNIVFALYLIGIIAALATGFLLKKTVLKGEMSEFIMELPPYRMPRLQNLLLHSWLKLKGFIFGAGKMIVMVVVVLSFLNSVGTDGSFGNEDSKKSVLSAIGRTITPVFAPIGLERDNWPAAVGLFTGIFAKEAVVGTLNSLYAADAGKITSVDKQAGLDLVGRLQDAFATIPANLAGLVELIGDPLGLAATRSQDTLAEAAVAQDVSTSTFGAMTRYFDGRIGAFAYLLFILLYFPCVAALSAVASESGGKWAVFAGLWSTGLAYFVAVIFYQSATLVRHPVSSLLWIAGFVAVMAGFIVAMRMRGEAKSPPGIVQGAVE
jgi:ferrous iron transport protein B